MKMPWFTMFVAALVMVGPYEMASAANAVAKQEPEPALVPWPASVTPAQGRTSLAATARIVAMDPSLKPLVAVLIGEIRRTTGLALTSGDGPARAGDVVLTIDPSLKSEAYTLNIGDRFSVTGHDYNAVATGTVTLIQSLQADSAGVSAPRMVIHDQPANSYRGIEIDCARQFHPVESLEQVVELARAYKIRYLHLHLSDDQGFTFPSAAFPKLATPGRSYTLDELRGLEKYANDRGVAIVPEIDVPGHSGGLNRVAPEIFGGRGSTINCGDEKAVAALDTLIGEMLEVFQSSPYFHIGCDEVNFGGVQNMPTFQARMKELGTNDPQDVFRWFIGQMDQAVRRHGRTTICWEGFGRGGKVHVPTDVIVEPFDCIYYGGTKNLFEDGYTVINCAWTPLYVVNDHAWQAERIYAWNKFVFGRFTMDYPKTIFYTAPKSADTRILGAQMCCWEQGPRQEVPSLRHRVPAMAERIWNPDADPQAKDYANFARRAKVADGLLQRLLGGMNVQVEGLTYPGWDGPGASVGGYFRDHATVTLTPVIPGTVVRYETNRRAVTANSPVCEKPLEITGSQTMVRARTFDAKGQPVGFPWEQTFGHRPIAATFAGQESGQSDTSAPSKDALGVQTRFKQEMTVMLRSEMPGMTIRYTLDGSDPKSSSPVATAPVKLTDSVKMHARCFNGANKPVGMTWGHQFQRTGPVPNLTLNKPVTCSSSGSDGSPENAVDGLVVRDKYWGTAHAPQWLKIDLQQVHTLDEVDVITYWGDGRYYQYIVEVSTDDKNWTQVVDMRNNKKAATQHGYHSKFAPTPARYIRVTMLKNSANPGLHIVEVRAFEAGK